MNDLRRKVIHFQSPAGDLIGDPFGLRMGALRAIDLESGFDHGRPPFGLTINEAGEYWVPGEEFETALEVIELRESGATYSEIFEKTGVLRSTAHRITEREDRYRILSEG